MQGTPFTTNFVPMPCIGHGLIITCNLCGPIDCGHFQLHMHLFLLDFLGELTQWSFIANYKDCYFKIHEQRHETLKKLNEDFFSPLNVTQAFLIVTLIEPMKVSSFLAYIPISIKHTFKKKLSIPSLYLAIYHSRHVFDKKYNGYIRPTYLG